MATAMARWRTGALTPFEWTNLSWFPLFAPSIRIEDFVDGDNYVVRAELPGVEPTKDVEITFVDGALRLHVVRTEEHKDHARSEFHYGSFFRSIPLPAGAIEEKITARYTDGILEITVPIGTPAPTGKPIPIEVVSTKQPVNNKKN
jgi:HSP20 family protein